MKRLRRRAPRRGRAGGYRRAGPAGGSAGQVVLFRAAVGWANWDGDD
jgi:hypothetical protein